MHLVAAENGLQVVAAIVLAGIILFELPGCGGRAEQHRTLLHEAEIDDLLDRFRWLAGMVTADRWFAATVLPQLHVLAWGNKRGV